MKNIFNVKQAGFRSAILAVVVATLTLAGCSSAPRWDTEYKGYQVYVSSPDKWIIHGSVEGGHSFSESGTGTEVFQLGEGDVIKMRVQKQMNSHLPSNQRQRNIFVQIIRDGRVVKSLSRTGAFVTFSLEHEVEPEENNTETE